MIYATRLAYVFDHPLTGPEHPDSGARVSRTQHPIYTTRGFRGNERQRVEIYPFPW